MALIVAAFMAGLGIGSYAGGVGRQSCRRPGTLLLFALIELAVGGFAALSCWFYYDFLGANAGWLYASLGRAGVVHLWRSSCRLA